MGGRRKVEEKTLDGREVEGLEGEEKEVEGREGSRKLKLKGRKVRDTKTIVFCKITLLPSLTCCCFSVVTFPQTA